MVINGGENQSKDLIMWRNYKKKKSWFTTKLVVAKKIIIKKVEWKTD